MKALLRPCNAHAHIVDGYGHLGAPSLVLILALNLPLLWKLATRGHRKGSKSGENALLVKNRLDTTRCQVKEVLIAKTGNEYRTP